MPVLVQAMFPELILMTVACALLLLGAVHGAAMRRVVPVIALLALVFVFGYQLAHDTSAAFRPIADEFGTLRVFNFAQYIKLLAAGVGILLILLAWPSNRDATGNAAIDNATEAGEFFALMLLSVSGIFVVAGANDIILLFLGVELASIPTYIMVSVSRSAPVAQEAGVKYFFLGAMSAALMLFGFSYLYGTTGLTNLSSIASRFAAASHRLGGAGADASASAVAFTPWQMLAVVMIIAGLAFEMAAVPLHFYAA